MDESTASTIIDRVFDGFKKCTPALVAVLVLSGLILFLPSSILEKMSLHSIPDTWKQVTGIVFLLSASIIISIVGFQIYTGVTAKTRRNRFFSSRIELTKKLSGEQKAILLSLLRSKDKSIVLDSNSGDTLYLVSNGFIHQPQQIISVGFDDQINLRYTPQAWLMDLYQNDPSIRGILEKKD